jgi:hypothetical protein
MITIRREATPREPFRLPDHDQSGIVATLAPA